MQIKLEEHTIREISENYKDSAENGVLGFNGKLNIRPAYQREFVYKDAQRDAVIDTIVKGFPLNVMYWCDTEDGCYELLDGQQRTISICQYVNGDFSLNNRTFFNLTETEKEQILNYKLMIYVCKGNDKEKLDWFKIINIAGEKLTDQELRNAVYTGSWLSDAKKHFSKNGCPAYKIGNKILNGDCNRQAYLQTAIEWKADADGLESIEAYMSAHQHDSSCNEMWLYFQNVITWVNTMFSKYRSQMKGVKWGILYNKYKDNSYDPAELEDEVVRLMCDDDVTKKSGIYEYLLSEKKKESCLSIRAFTDSQKTTAYERQKGICPICKLHFEKENMEGDHITPWCEGGKTDINNLQMLCKECNRRKSSK